MVTRSWGGGGTGKAEKMDNRCEVCSIRGINVGVRMQRTGNLINNATALLIQYILKYTCTK